MTLSLFQNRILSHKFVMEVCRRPGSGRITGTLFPREQSNDYDIIIKTFCSLTCIDHRLLVLFRRGSQHDGRRELEPVVEHVNDDRGGQDHPAPAPLRIVVPLKCGPLSGGQRRQRTRVGHRRATAISVHAAATAAAAADTAEQAGHVVRGRGARPIVRRAVVNHVHAAVFQLNHHHGPRIAPRHHVHVAVQLHSGHCAAVRRRRRRSLSETTKTRSI